MASLAVFIKAIFSCQFYGALVCLRAAVTEKHLCIASDLAELFGKIRLHLGVVQIRRMLERMDLLTDGFYPVGVAIAQGVCTNAAAKVDIGFSGSSAHDSPAPWSRTTGKTSIGWHHKCTQLFLCCHSKDLPKDYIMNYQSIKNLVFFLICITKMNRRGCNRNVHKLCFAIIMQAMHITSANRTTSPAANSCS